MSLRARLLALIVLVAAVPLSLSAWMALRVHQRAFNEQVAELQALSARTGARVAQAWLDSSARSFELLAGQVEWPTLSAAEREGALWLVYHQSDDVAAVALLDEQRRAIGVPAFDPAESAPRAEPNHPALAFAALERLDAGFPIEASRRLAAGWAVGSPIEGAQGAAPILPAAFSVEGRRAEQPWTLGLGVSLRGLCAELSQSVTSGAVELLLIGEDDRILCAREIGALSPAPASLVAAIAQGGSGAYQASDGRAMQAVVARLPSSGWRVVAQQPAEVALAPGRRIRSQAIMGIAASLLLALAGGLLLARRIVRPVRRLAAGAAAIGQGQLDHRFEETGDREMSQLGIAFNRMTAEIAERDAELHAFNEELQERVVQRTRELRDAQEQLLRSDKLAAVNALGAGIAHEINNPLTAVLSFAQLLIKRGPGDPRGMTALLTIESEAQRIAEIVEKLQRLSREFAGEGFRPLSPQRLAEDALSPLMARMVACDIKIDRRFEQPLPSVPGHEEDLLLALREIFKNAFAAMPEGGTLTVSARSLDGRAVVIGVNDTGVGIAADRLERIFDPFQTTKPEEGAAGLGLSVAHEIVTQHHGRIHIASRPGAGTRVRVTLPVASEPHLV